jgi:hypothetical protein
MDGFKNCLLMCVLCDMSFARAIKPYQRPKITDTTAVLGSASMRPNRRTRDSRFVPDKRYHVLTVESEDSIDLITSSSFPPHSIEVLANLALHT